MKTKSSLQEKIGLEMILDLLFPGSQNNNNPWPPRQKKKNNNNPAPPPSPTLKVYED